MEASTLRLHHGEEELIECWDDDGDLQWVDDIQFPTASSANSLTGSSVRRSGHRDSISSRRSARSDLDSNAGDEDWQVLLQDNDDAATEEAIASAKSAGIPIPPNVPKSALLGGTIKRLGRRKTKKAAIDDWSEDLDLSAVNGELTLRAHENRIFPESLRQIGSAVSSPVKCRSPTLFDMGSSPQSRPTVPNLAAFQDSEDLPDLQDVPTIKVPKSRAAQKQPAVDNQKATEDVEDFEQDLVLPDDGTPLRLSTRKEMPETTHHISDDFDLEWAEGSIGVRFGGTMRDGRSNRSSSASALSPSVSSCLTGESEDDGLDGLILPDGPLNLEESLKKRQEMQPPQEVPKTPSRTHGTEYGSGKDDFFSDLEIGDGDVFNPGKLTLNQNIKRKVARPSSPARRSATTITFTNKPVSPKTRIPRLSGHDRSHSTHLEPVSESGAPLQQFRRPQSRFGGHISHSSLPTLPTTTHTSTPSTPSRRPFGIKASRDVKNEPTTTSAQLLRAKRSMPAMRSTPTHGPTLPYQRSPSRHEGTHRPSSSTRPKTPVERIVNDSRLISNRRTPAPFLPAGASQDQSHHVSVKNRNLRRKDSDSSTDTHYVQRPTSRHSTSTRSDTPGRSSTELAPETLAAAAKRTITRPTRKRNFGDGTELESFDDLPTSASAESKFVKQPVGRGAPRSLRLKSTQPQAASIARPDNLILPATPVTSRPQDSTPRFARDTAASRNAREQRIASLNMSLRDRDGGPLAPVSANWKAHVTSHGSSSSSTVKSRRGKSGGSSSNKPHLIKPMGAGVHEAKCA